MELRYDLLLFEEWKKGWLQRRWRKEHPSIVDVDDLRLALSQRNYHFGEWYAARYFAKKGYKVLIEKYIYAAHPQKIRTMKKRWPGLLNYLRLLCRKYHCQPADLLVYKGSDFFLVEVKRDGDREQWNQRKMFAILRKDLERPIKTCRVLQKR